MRAKDDDGLPSGSVPPPSPRLRKVTCLYKSRRQSRVCHPYGQQRRGHMILNHVFVENRMQKGRSLGGLTKGRRKELRL